MKVAVLSDIHGNMRALDAVLDDIASQRVDRVICAGDVPNPFLRSLDAWLKLKALGIPVIRGNHEDYIVSYYSGDRPEILSSPQFLPIQVVARHLGPEVAREFAALPFDLVVEGPGGDDLYVCHASPQHNARSYIRGVDAAMATAFKQVSARTVVAGHIHNQWSGAWENRQLVICGSVGLPHNQKPEALYTVLTHDGQAWGWDQRQVPYDALGAMREYVESGAVAQGGPMAWLLYDEIWCAEPRLAHFLPRVLAKQAPHQLTSADWAVEAEAYLREIGRWDALKGIR